MTSIQKWFLAIASLLVIFFVTFLIVYQQPQIQAIPPLKLKLELDTIEAADANSSLEYQQNTYLQEISSTDDPNVRIDSFRDYLTAIVTVDEFNMQETYEDRPTLENTGLDITKLMGALMIADIEHDTTVVFERYEEYVGISKRLIYLIESSKDDEFTKEQQQEIEKAYAKFEQKGESLISVVDQLYPK